MVYVLFEGRSESHVAALRKAEKDFSAWRALNPVVRIVYLTTSSCEMVNVSLISAVICVWYE